MALEDRDPLIGRILDERYRVLRHIADGGMGSVYVALDQRLERHIALKVMREDFARDSAFVERFRREARSAARLTHPNVVGVYDQGSDEGRLFLAMELVTGRTLRAWLGEVGALTPRESLDVLDAVLRALAAAHQAGIIHRDIKPENVLIGDDGAVKVADFGLARAVSTHSSTSGTMLGTVAYLAPEQVERGIADARSDVYAAGLLLFEMLTGRKAVEGESPIHVAYQHVHGTIPAPSEQIPGLPAELDALVRWATQRDPDDRPVDAAALLTQLRGSRSVLTAEQLDARPLVAGFSTSAEATSALHQPTTAMPLTRGGLGGEPGPLGGSGGTGAPGGPSTPVPPLTGGSPASRHGATRTKTPRSTRSRVLLSLLIAVLVVAAGVGWYSLLGPGAARIVPTLVGKTKQVAIDSLAAVDLGANIVDVFSEEVNAGVVMSTDPKGNSDAKRGQVVSVSVSKGKERYVVPDLSGKSVADATNALTQLHLVVSSTRDDYSETVAVGSVMGTDPATGASLKRDTPVTLVISKGRQPFTLVSKVGQPLAEARKEWEAAGLTVVVSGSEYSTDVAKDGIVSQAPETATLYKGDTVTVVVSKGPDLVQVPSVRGKSEADAKQTLEAAGFAVDIQRLAGGIFGTAHSTDPSGGSQAPRGSRVTLRIV